jgi:tRNA pseudouridine55 synthase
MKRPPSAVWLYEKPVGESSHAVVQRFRAEHEGPWTLKASHAGVLDPFAHGLVIVLVGAATRLFERLHEVPKRYVAEVQWGVETDTGDAGGKVTLQTGRTPPEAERDTALRAKLGWTDQVPPATSNKRVDGERAWQKAHRGEEVVLPASQVFLHTASWRAHEQPDRAWLEVTVRGGFYVRSLVRDLGQALGVGAHVVSLERTAIGPYTTPANGPVQKLGLDVLPWLPIRRLSDDEVGRARKGEALAMTPVEPRTWSLPAGFPMTNWVRLVHGGKVVGVSDGQVTTELPGGV